MGQKNNQLTIVERDLGAVQRVADVAHDIIHAFKSQSLITPSDIKALGDAKEFAISAFVDTPQYRPMVVKLASVLSDGQFPTADAKFWQCKAEAEVHFNELMRNIYKIESIKVDLEEIDYKIKSLRTLCESDAVPADVGDPQLMKLDYKRLIIKRDSIEFELKLIEKNTKYRMEEVTDWCSIAGNLVSACKYDTHNKQDGMTQSLFLKLEYEISKATDEKSKKNLTDQLNTLKRLLFEKAKKSIQ
jgi:hypothetical protein